MKRPSRDPGAAIKRMLREEVNFGCPVRTSDGGCGSPLLVFHHFDPPWRGNYVHNPEGMIALCLEHHAQADALFWTKQQLRDFKRTPFVDDAIRMAWPWTPETLTVRAGKTLVIGSGSPLRMGGRPIISFRRVEVPSLGVTTVEFDADIRDANGDKWLTIDRSYFDLRLEGTTDVRFLPSTKELDIRRDDAAKIKLRLDVLTHDRFATQMRTVGMGDDVIQSSLTSIEKNGGIDSDGRIPLLCISGRFTSRYADADISENNFHLRTMIPGFEHEKVEMPWVVSEHNRLSIRESRSNLEYVRIG
jgi:hypothetical protein